MPIVGGESLRENPGHHGMKSLPLHALQEGLPGHCGKYLRGRGPKAERPSLGCGEKQGLIEVDEQGGGGPLPSKSHSQCSVHICCPRTRLSIGLACGLSVARSR